MPILVLVSPFARLCCIFAFICPAIYLSHCAHIYAWSYSTDAYLSYGHPEYPGIQNYWLRISLVNRMANTEAGMHCDITGSQKLSYSFNRCAFVKSTCCLTAFFLTPWKEIESVRGLQLILLLLPITSLWKPSSSTSFTKRRMMGLLLTLQQLLEYC